MQRLRRKNKGCRKPENGNFSFTSEPQEQLVVSGHDQVSAFPSGPWVDLDAFLCVCDLFLYVFKCTPFGWSHPATDVSLHKLSSMGCPCAAGHGPCFLGHLVLSCVTNGYRYMFSQQFIPYQSLEKTHRVGLGNICVTLLSILT